MATSVHSGGLLVAATMKYADNIVKCFAAALAILSGTLLSIPLFGFQPSHTFALGVGLTVVASTIYSSAPETPQWFAARVARGRVTQQVEEEEEGISLIRTERGARSS